MCLSVSWRSFGCYSCLTIRTILVAQRAELRKQYSFRRDRLVASRHRHISWEVMLARAKSGIGWRDPFWRVQNFSSFIGGGSGCVDFWALRHEPRGQFPPLGERNFAACCVIILRLPRALCRHQVIARSAANPVWLRCAEDRDGDVAFADLRRLGDADAVGRLIGLKVDARDG